MKKILWFVLPLSLLFPTKLSAQSLFNGTWKLDPETAQTQAKPDVYLLKDGIYDCSTCDPPLHLNADGSDQKITGDSCYDTVNVKILDDNTIEVTYRKNGSPVETSTTSVSPDGKTATTNWTSRCNPKGEPISVKYIETRVDAAPPGAHVISGSWRLTKRIKQSDSVFTGTVKLEGDNFSFSDPVGYGYTAKLDGTETPMGGTQGKEMVSVKRLAENVVEETHKEDGKVTEIVRYTVSAGGKTMTITIAHPISGTTTTYAAEKQ
jgi:hypothetical protein